MSKHISSTSTCCKSVCLKARLTTCNAFNLFILISTLSNFLAGNPKTFQHNEEFVFSFLMTIYVDGCCFKRNLIRSDVYCLVRDDELVALIDEQVVVEVDD